MGALSIFSLLALAVVLTLSLKVAPAGLWGKPLISCYMIVLGLFAVYFLMPGVLLLIFTDGQYLWLPRYGGAESITWTALVATFAVLMFVGGYALRSRGPRSVPPVIAQPVHPDPLAIQIAWVLVVIGTLLKLYVIVNSGGLEETILRQSSGVRLNMRLDDVSASLSRVWFLSSMADAAITWLLVRKMHSRENFTLLIAVFLLVTALTFVSTGKRLYILWPILTFMVGIHFYVKPLRLRHLPIAGITVLGLGFATLMFRIFAPANLANFSIDLDRVYWAEGSLFRFYFMSAEFSSFELLTLAIEDPELIVGQFGGAWQAFTTTNIEPFGYFVPRDVWPGKPNVFVDLAHANRVIMAGGSLFDGGGVNSMLPATSWTIAGPLGLAVAMALLGWISAAADGMRAIRGIPSPMRLLTYAFIIATVFHLFRQGTLAWTFIIVVAQHLGLVLSIALLSLVDIEGSRRRVRATAFATGRGPI